MSTEPSQISNALPTSNPSSPGQAANPPGGISPARDSSASRASQSPAATTNPPQQGTAAAPVPGSLCIPPSDLKPLYDSIENCEACAANLTASEADLADERAKFTAASTERDAALRAARGTFWSRTARAAKWFAIGAAAGAVLARYH